MTVGIHNLQHRSHAILVHKVPQASEDVRCSSCDRSVSTAKERFHRNPPKRASARLNVRSAEPVWKTFSLMCAPTAEAASYRARSGPEPIGMTTIFWGNTRRGPNDVIARWIGSTMGGLPNG